MTELERIALYRPAMFFFSSRRRHTRFDCDWSSDVCSSDLDPLEFLLAMGCLDYADYREWRQRRRRELQSALRIPVEEVTAALAHAQAYAAEQHLSIEPCPPTAWDQDQGPLSIGPSNTLGQL